jgi:hypothetical protein
MSMAGAVQATMKDGTGRRPPGVVRQCGQCPFPLRSWTVRAHSWDAIGMLLDNESVGMQLE